MTISYQESQKNHILLSLSWTKKEKNKMKLTQKQLKSNIDYLVNEMFKIHDGERRHIYEGRIATYILENSDKPSLYWGYYKMKVWQNNGG